MSWVRRGLLELWAMVILAGIVGFLGPFGTYLDAEFPARAWNWFTHLMGAYVLVRPTIWLLIAIANATSLPRNALLFWGVLLSSFPLTLVWVWGGGVFFHALGGFTGILPLALLSAVAILVVVWWAKRIDAQLSDGHQPHRDRIASFADDTPIRAAAPERDEALGEPLDDSGMPRLQRRLSKAFAGPIVALQSEDHYVRVHGAGSSELLLMRLRDAIAEMDECPGQQVHRSWWVAREGIASVESDGRNRVIRLTNGEFAPIARDSISSLERQGFLKTSSN